MDQLIALGVLVLLIVTLIVAQQPRLRMRFVPRLLAPTQALRQQVSRAVESGGALHVSLGTGAVGGADTMTSLAGVTILNYLSAQSAAANVPPTVTIADPTLLPIAQDSLRRAFTARARRQNYHPEQVVMLTPHPEAYAAATMSVAQDSATTGNVLVGSFGAEVVLLAEAASRINSPEIAGVAEPIAQAVLYPVVDNLLLGEELFVAQAYLAPQPQMGDLLAFDAARVMVVVGIIVLTVVKLFVPG